MTAGATVEKEEWMREKTQDDQRQAKQILPGFSSPWQLDDSASNPSPLKGSEPFNVHNFLS